MSATQAAKLSAEMIVARQFGAIGRHDPEALAACYSEDAIVHDPMYPEPLRGRAAIARDFADLYRAIPDFKATVTHTLSGDGSHAVEFVMSGTHTGPLKTPDGDIPATNRRIELGGSGFARTDADGHITHERRYYDMATMLGQLGLMT